MNVKSISRDKIPRKVPGQVFTPAPLAQFMFSLFKREIKAHHQILDPCIGPNTFLSPFDEFEIKPNLVGIELDESLITKEIISFYSKPKRQLIIDNFFEFPLSRKFDFIIQNPPYLRQELLRKGKNAKSILGKLCPLPVAIPAQSNLYVYFLLKSIFHLNDGGRMIAIMYDSWLYSHFGKFLKESLNRFGSVEAIYHFRANAFPDIAVGATIIDFRRMPGPGTPDKPMLLYSFASATEIEDNLENTSCLKKIPAGDILTHRFNEETVLDFRSELFRPIEKMSSQQIQRGVCSVANKYFIQNKKIFKESIPFIKDVTTIPSFVVNDQLSYLLSLNGHISKKAKKHLAIAKKEILSQKEKFSALRKEVKDNKSWYKIRLKKPGNIIFNYYLRKNIDFILNPGLHYASDNFYILNIKRKTYANLAILNSSFTRIALLLHSRNQGKGLRKIQLYEFREISILNCERLRSTTLARLEKLGRALSSVDRFSPAKEKMVGKIDEVLLGEYNRQSPIQITAARLQADRSRLMGG